MKLLNADVILASAIIACSGTCNDDHQQSSPPYIPGSGAAGAVLGAEAFLDVGIEELGRDEFWFEMISVRMWVGMGGQVVRSS